MFGGGREREKERKRRYIGSRKGAREREREREKEREQEGVAKGKGTQARSGRRGRILGGDRQRAWCYYGGATRHSLYPIQCRLNSTGQFYGVGLEIRRSFEASHPELPHRTGPDPRRTPHPGDQLSCHYRHRRPPSRSNYLRGGRRIESGSTIENRFHVRIVERHRIGRSPFPSVRAKVRQGSIDTCAC